ncbi:MAG: hypothetical protein EP301_07385 [Gammaproteobacteria bacterium]|nr:MAG: hypothetical protein EP301_07385 [Gammaproteobacteria bacterium]
MSLFGGTEKIDILTGGQKRLLRGLTDILGEQLGQGGPVYGGQITPGATPLQQQAFGLAGQAIPGVGGALSQMLSGAPDPEMIRNYYETAVAAPARLGFEDTMRDISGRLGETYGTSGGLGAALGSAAARFNTGLAGQLAGLQFGERQSALNRQAQAVPMALAQRQQQLGQMLGAGGTQRAIQGQQLGEDYAKWQQAQPYANPWLTGFLGPALGTPGFGYGHQQGLMSKIANIQGGITQMALPIGGILGGGGGGGGGY